MVNDERQAQIWDEIAELRDRLGVLLAELEADAESPPARKRFTLLQGGLSGLALPVLWLARRRPHAGAIVATGVAMAIAASVVTAIAVPAPLARQATAPPPVITVTVLGSRPPASTIAASTTPPGSTASIAPAAPGSTIASTTMPGPSPSSSSSAGSTAGSSPSASASTPTPSSNTPTPPPASCLITLAIEHIIDICAL